MVSFHAHPDDEALLTGGTLARAAAQGHRVVLVTATAGEAGLASSSIRAAGPLAGRRVAELHRAGQALGSARIEVLGYPDSGMDGQAMAGGGFAGADVEAAARRLAKLLAEERADVLTTYDAAGGYGHPDHRQVHRVGARAAQLASTPVLLEATIDRDVLLRAARLVHKLPGLPAEFDPARLAAAYAPRASITHRVDVRPFLAAKRAAMRAHASQATADDTRRALAIFLRLPRPVFGLLFGREWFTEAHRRPVRPPLDDIFATLRARTAATSAGSTRTVPP